MADLSAKGQSTRRRIIRGALEVFRAKGYHGCSMTDLAEAAEVSVPGLYHHFPSKQALLFDALDEGMSTLLDHLDEAERAHDDPLDRFRSLVARLATWQARNTVDSFVFISELRSLEGENAETMRRSRLRVQQYFDDVVVTGHESGAFTTTMPFDVSRAVVALCVNISSWYSPDGPLTPEQVADTYVQLCLQLVMPSADADRAAAGPDA